MRAASGGGRVMARVTVWGVLRMYQRRQDDSIRDTFMYSVLASEWATVREGLLKRLMP